MMEFLKVFFSFSVFLLCTFSMIFITIIVKPGRGLFQQCASFLVAHQLTALMRLECLASECEPTAHS